jgi:uncharacterized protein YuzE
MKVIYDAVTDTLQILFSGAAVAESDEERAGLVLDYDATGNVVGLEVLNASKRVENPKALEYAVTG